MRSRRLIIAMFVAGSLWISGPAVVQAQVFYRVTGPQDQLNWLLGTVHSEDPRLLEFPPALELAIAQARIVALELSPDEDAFRRIRAQMQASAEIATVDLVDSKQRARLVAALADYGYNREQALGLSPWAAAMTLSQPVAESGVYMDRKIALLARRYGARVVALETIDQQLALVSDLDRETYRRMIVRALDEHGHGHPAYAALVEAYLARDLDRLGEMLRRELVLLSSDFAEHFVSQGLQQRNQSMLEKALPLLAQGDTLITVGVLHLVGEAGMVELLRRQGYRLRAVF